jgi:hypothetical protein
MFQPQKSKGSKVPDIAIRIRTQQLKWEGRPTGRMETEFLDFEDWVSRCRRNLSRRRKDGASVGNKPNVVVLPEQNLSFFHWKSSRLGIRY